MLMNTHERIAKTLDDLFTIDFYDRVMFNCGICNAEVLNNMLVQDELLKRLERLDYDAYLLYITGEWDTLYKYYTREGVTQ